MFHADKSCSSFLSAKLIALNFFNQLFQSYRFGSYSTPVFACIRRAVDVSEEDYIQSLAPPHLPYLEFISNSRSGQDFYFRYMYSVLPEDKL